MLRGFVGSHRKAEAVLVSVEQHEALLEASKRQHAGGCLGVGPGGGLEPSTEDLALFTEVAAGRMTTEQLRDRSAVSGQRSARA